MSMTPDNPSSTSPTGFSEPAAKKRRERNLRARGLATGDIRRGEILAFASRYIREHGYAPSHKEMRKALYISAANLFHHMRVLRSRGEVIGPGDGARTWTLPKFAAACKDVE